MSLSIIILAQDEEQDLSRLLESIRWCDDIHLVDSGSTDRTKEIAQAAGVQVVEHPFAAFGQQRNWSLDHCALRHNWILFLDADEASTMEFHAAVMSAIANAPESVAGFYCCWKMIVEGVWLKRCDSFPKWQFRLLRRGRARFVDFGHGQKEGEVDGTLDYIREPYLHFVVSKGWEVWKERHDRYAAQEAEVRSATPIRWREIFASHPSIRNKALKPLVSRIPGWPVIRFVQAWLLSGGFLEGRPGLTYCLNLAQVPKPSSERRCVNCMRVIVWGINYAPEFTGIAPHNVALCEFLHARGHDVEMVTTFSYYPTWRKRPEDRGQLFRTDVINGVPVHRCWHFVPEQVSAVKRILHEASFILTSTLQIDRPAAA